MTQVFLSYSRKDKVRVDRVISLLQQYNIIVWIDRTGIRGGEEWRSEIVSAIKESAVFILLLSPNSTASDNVRKEVDVAESLKKHILPAQIEPTEIPESLLYQLAGLQIVELSGDLESSVRALAEAIYPFVPQPAPLVGQPIQKPEIPAVPPRRFRPNLLWVGGLAAFLLVFFIVYAAARQISPSEIPTPVQTSTFLAAATLAPSPTLFIAPTRPSATLLNPSRIPSLVLSTNHPSLLPSSTPTPAQAVTSASACTSAGQTWVRPKDRMTMICVPAGSFALGYPNCKDSWCQNEANLGSITVTAFWIDRSEVTNAQFQRYVSDTGFVTGAEKSGGSEVYGVNLPVPGANWRAPQGSDSSISNKSNHPVVQMDWYSANTYCKWAGGRLPNEAQWEKAARGTDGRLFPWGNFYPDKSMLNAAGQADGFLTTAPVGSFVNGNSPYGLYDMAGNAYEWTRSLMMDYPYDFNDGREMDTNPDPNAKMVMRGGSFYTDYGTVRSTWRAEEVAQNANDGIGFRCVIDR